MVRAHSRRTFLIQASNLALLGSAAAASALPRTGPIHISIANASGGLNLTMAALMRQQKLLEAFGLDPEVIAVADGTRILGGVVGGSVDATFMSGFGQVFPAVARGAGVKILAGGALLPVLALFSARPDIKALKDLEGRTIGSGSIGSLVYQLTVTLLQKYQVNLSHIRFVNIGSSSDVFRSVSAGAVDAGVGDAALISEAARYGVHLLDHGDMSVELKQYTYQGAWASDRKIASERDTIVRALAAYAQLYRFVQRADSREAFLRARRSAFANAPESDHEALWNYIQAYKPFAVDLRLSPERLRYMQELNVGFKVQSAVLPFDRVADMSLAADALKLLTG
jgi:ABC-type nitrate/sulfonate/bicarbonate transport system substrate-binding protein